MTKKIIGIALVLSAFVFLMARAEKDEFTMISVDQAVAMMKQPNTYFIDANSKSTFEKGHIAHDPPTRWVKFRSYDKKELPEDKEASLIFYCSNMY